MVAIKTHASLLHRNAELLDEIYRARNVSARPETERALAKLESARILLCDEEGNYRLHPRERRYFDGVYDRNRILETSGEIASEIRRLGEITILMHACGQAGDEEGLAEHLENAIDTIMTLRVQIDDKVRIFDLEMRNGYHDARTLEERIKRNEVYLSRVRELIDVVVQLNSSSVQDFFSSPHARAVRRSYSRDIGARIEPWSIRLSGLAREMLDFMYRSKRISERTKWFRAMQHGLANVSPGEKIETLQVAETAFAAVDLDLRIAVDTTAEANEAALMGAAEKLDAGSSRSKRRERHAAGKVAQEAPPPPEALDPVDSMIDTLVGLARQGRVSVRDWADAHCPEVAGQLVVDLFDHMTEGEVGLRMSTVPEGCRHATSGVHDVILEAAG